MDEVQIEALKQIIDMKYRTELIQSGISHIIELAIVFKGKEISIYNAENQDYWKSFNNPDFNLKVDVITKA